VLESATVAIRTALTEMFDLACPVVLAPMAIVSGGELAAVVSNAGGLGLVGGGYGDLTWLERELEIVSRKTERGWGVGLITWRAGREALELALSYSPHIIFLSFGDASDYVPMIKDAGCRLICQVQDVAAAKEAAQWGADLIVAQGTEAGGHGARRGTLPLVPTVVDAVSPVPVLAAGGIGDGRGLAAAMALGAVGAVIGTRFCATEESLMHPVAKQLLISATGDETVRTPVFDQVRGFAWPEGFTGRAIRNAFVDRWHGRSDGLDRDLDERQRYLSAVDAGDFDTALIWAGEIVDMVDRVEPAAAVVEQIGAEAATWLRGADSFVT
jgi:nitronate monooxygenase